LGDGIGKHNGKPVFVSKSVVGDSLRVRIIHETSEFKRGEIIEILEAGATRTHAPCPYFAACGGCSLQQMGELNYRSFKTKIVQNAMKQAGFADDDANKNVCERIVFLPAASRRRAEFKLCKERGNWSLAFIGNRSHDKVSISNCLILEPELQQILPLLAQLIGGLSFVRDIEEVRLTAADSGVEVVLTLARTAKTPVNLTAIKSELQHIADAAKLMRVSLTNSRFVPIEVAENGYLTMRLGKVDIHLPQDAFLQATREGGRLLSKFAKHETRGCKRILDLFCGIGTYSVALCEDATVHAVDDHELMVMNLRHASRTGNMRLTTEKRNLFTNPFSAFELGKFDGVVLNPPRSGAKAQVEQIAASVQSKNPVKNVVMISCNPATFARDAKILKNAGFIIKNTLAIDQFVYSPHLEIAAHFGLVLG
jgi:23S rRNA (uracil1939-C5)-methyltransferase